MKPVETLALILLAALWGASYLFIRVASPVIGPVLLVEVRLLLAAAVLLLYALARGQKPVTFDHWPSFVVLGLVNAAVPFTLVAIAELRLTASVTSILSATNPMFTAAIAAFVLRDSLDIRRCIGLALGFAGVVIVVGWSAPAIDASVVLAAAAALVAMLCYASGSVYAVVRLPNTSPLTLATMQQLTAALVLAPVAAVVAVARPPTTAPSPSVMLAVVALAVLSTSVAYLLFFFLLNRVGPTRTATTSYLVPVFGIVWGATFLHEPVPLGMIVGSVAVGLGLALVLGRIGGSRTLGAGEAARPAAGA